MAGDAAARLYDVDEDSVVFQKLQKTQQYDQGVFTFRARRGKLIDLDKLHESIRATRLSGSTRSGLVSLDVTVVGSLFVRAGQTVLKVADSQAEFVLAKHPDSESAAAFGQIQSAAENANVRVTGRIDNYRGRWPDLLSKKPSQPRRLLVASVEAKND